MISLGTIILVIYILIKGIDNGEYAVYQRPHGELGIHKAAVWKLGGCDEDGLR
jgi:hypothetical protein